MAKINYNEPWQHIKAKTCGGHLLNGGECQDHHQEPKDSVMAQRERGHPGTFVTVVSNLVLFIQR